MGSSTRSTAGSRMSSRAMLRRFLCPPLMVLSSGSRPGYMRRRADSARRAGVRSGAVSRRREGPAVPGVRCSTGFSKTVRCPRRGDRPAEHTPESASEHCVPCDVASVEQQPPGTGPEFAREQREQRRLSGTAPSHYRDKLASLHGEAEVVKTCVRSAVVAEIQMFPSEDMRAVRR